VVYCIVNDEAVFASDICGRGRLAPGSNRNPGCGLLCGLPVFVDGRVRRGLQENGCRSQSTHGVGGTGGATLTAGTRNAGLDARDTGRYCSGSGFQDDVGPIDARIAQVCRPDEKRAEGFRGFYRQIAGAGADGTRRKEICDPESRGSAGESLRCQRCAPRKNEREKMPSYPGQIRPPGFHFD